MEHREAIRDGLNSASFATSSHPCIFRRPPIIRREKQVQIQGHKRPPGFARRGTRIVASAAGSCGLLPGSGAGLLADAVMVSKTAAGNCDARRAVGMVGYHVDPHAGGPGGTNCEPIAGRNDSGCCGPHAYLQSIKTNPSCPEVSVDYRDSPAWPILGLPRGRPGAEGDSAGSPHPL